MRAGGRGDRGGGLIGTIAAILVFLLFLLFAVQLLVGLYSRSVITGVAYDGARTVAGHRAPISPDAQSEAESRMRQELGSFGQEATFEWTTDNESVQLRLRTRSPRFLFGGYRGPLAADYVERTVRIRREEPR